MTDEFEFIQIGSKRHLKLKAILAESLRIKGMAGDSNEVIALALGYDPADEKRFRSAKNMLYRLLRASDTTITRLADFHVEALARFCHRLVRFNPDFTATCSTELTYGDDVDQLLADI